MKKYFSIIAALLAVSLTGCSSPSENGSKTNDQPSVVSDSAGTGNSDSSDSEKTTYVYGTATLSYAEFYGGDVSSVNSFDAVSSATNSKHSILKNTATDFVDETANANGYRITGVKNVNVAISEADLEKFTAINPSFVRLDSAPEQYKTVTLDGGKAVYSATKFNVADTVTDASAELLTGTNWGDYQINVTDGKTVHLRNTREDEFDINSEIQGIILETKSGLKVGMEALQSIWVQPYEVSWNVEADNSHNTHIAAYDNLPELSKLTGETVTKITYIMPGSTYVYEFEGIYIKPIYDKSFSSAMDGEKFTLSSGDFSDFNNGRLVVAYTLGSGRNREVYKLFEGSLENNKTEYTLDLSEISTLENKAGVYSAVISSDSYADITVPVPASAEQKKALKDMRAKANEKLSGDPDNKTLKEHIGEADELLGSANASSSQMGSLINELDKLINPPENNGQGGQSGHGAH